jgi:2,4-dienoyl-CoA reductase-like NADH-dependent reductase (Old Yellow Enzyme family)
LWYAERTDNDVPEPSYTHLGGLRDIEGFRRYLAKHQINIPCDNTLISGATSPLAQPIDIGDIKVGNRIAAQPMEGWDSTGEGRPTELTFRRWGRFGASGAKLIWGGEAVAVRHDGRANPNQLLINKDSRDDLSRLRETLVTAHKQAVGSDSDLLIGLQLTHSGRYSRPNAHGRPEPKIVYHHPILDSRLGITSEYPVLTDRELKEIIEDFHNAAVVAAHAGFDFVDIKHCHGYLGHELLSAHTREGEFGGSFENRTRFLREITNAVRAASPALSIAVRFSAFDLIPFRKPMGETCGVPESIDGLLPYRWAFGVNVDDPIEPDLREPIQFLQLLRDLGVKLINISAGSPYYNPHIQRPASYPPSDGYSSPEDPLAGVARQMRVTRELKQQFPELIVVGSAYSYLQDFLPYVAQAAIREGWTDFVGLGRMILAYPSLLLDVVQGRTLQRKHVCRTFSDCTTAPRAGLPSGCYPLDPHYKNSANATQLKKLKAAKKNAE